MISLDGSSGTYYANVEGIDMRQKLVVYSLLETGNVAFISEVVEGR